MTVTDMSLAAEPVLLTAGPYRLDLADERLWKAGAPVRVGGKALSLMRVLMQSPQTLVTKDEIFERVWLGLAVSDAVLTTAMKELRQALGDDARQPRVIETVHGRGYRFLLPVRAVARPSAVHTAPQTPRGWGAIVAAGLALAVAAALRPT